MRLLGGRRERMKALVAVTCIAVLAAVGYFFWGEYRTYLIRAEADMQASMERAERARIQTARSACFDDFKRHIQAKVADDLLPLERRAECSPLFTETEKEKWRAEIR
jgi:Tfp pilus assembly protein PilE